MRKRNTIPKYRARRSLNARERRKRERCYRASLTQSVVRKRSTSSRRATRARIRAFASHARQRFSTEPPHGGHLLINNPVSPVLRAAPDSARACNERPPRKTRAALNLNYNIANARCYSCAAYIWIVLAQMKRNSFEAPFRSQRQKGRRGRAESRFRLNGVSRSVRHSLRE